MLALPNGDDSISVVDNEFHSYIPYASFGLEAHDQRYVMNSRIFCATAQIVEQEPKRPWSELKTIVDKFHKHACVAQPKLLRTAVS